MMMVGWKVKSACLPACQAATHLAHTALSYNDRSLAALDGWLGLAWLVVYNFYIVACGKTLGLLEERFGSCTGFSSYFKTKCRKTHFNCRKY